MIKTYAEWEGNLHDYLSIGDLVDEEIVKHFINVVPPACNNGSVVQLGESYTHVDDKPIYPTLKRTENGWAYAGYCFRGQTENKRS